MFEHSVKVPQLYKTASKILKSVREDRGSVKGLLYQRKHQNIKALYSLVVECLKRYNQIEYLLKRSELLRKEPRLDPWLARILVTELLWGKRRLPGDSKPIRTVLAYHQILLAHSTDIVDDAVKPRAPKPRYVRVNTLRGNTASAIDAFSYEGWTFVRHADAGDYAEYVERLRTLGENEFTVDAHIDDLLVFPPQTQFHRHEACTSGAVILQDKASCVPVQILNPPPGSVVLDMCAAPGIKTTQIAARMDNDGTVYAIERDAKRFAMLNEMIELCGATCVKTLNTDVLKVTGKDLEDVEYVLVDPSCTGSGIVDNSRVDEPGMENPQRIHSLAHFQIKILKHALHRFAKTKRVVYSTCSVNEQENEHVVREVLESERCYKLVPVRHRLWPDEEPGDPDDVSSYCINFRPDRDLTNGFFVAAFERLEPGETNRFFVPYSRRYDEGKDLEVLYLNDSQRPSEKGYDDALTAGRKELKSVSMIEDSKDSKNGDDFVKRRKKKRDVSEEPSKQEGKKLKKKKTHRSNMEPPVEFNMEEIVSDLSLKTESEGCSVFKIKKKKKSRDCIAEDNSSRDEPRKVKRLSLEDAEVDPRKKKKKKRDLGQGEALVPENHDAKKKKKKADRVLVEDEPRKKKKQQQTSVVDEAQVRKKKKKTKNRSRERRVSFNSRVENFIYAEVDRGVGYAITPLNCGSDGRLAV